MPVIHRFARRQTKPRRRRNGSPCLRRRGQNLPAAIAAPSRVRRSISSIDFVGFDNCQARDNYRPWNALNSKFPADQLAQSRFGGAECWRRTRMAASNPGSLDTFPRLLLNHALVPAATRDAEEVLGIWQTRTGRRWRGSRRPLPAGWPKLDSSAATTAIIGDNRPRLYWSMRRADAGQLRADVPGRRGQRNGSCCGMPACASSSSGTRSRWTRCWRSGPVPRPRNMSHDDPRGMRHYDRLRGPRRAGMPAA